MIASLVPERDYDYTAQFSQPDRIQLPPPEPPYSGPLPVSALLAAKKKLDDDTTSTWLLVGLGALAAWAFSGYLAFMLFSIWMILVAGFAGWGANYDPVASIFSTLFGIALSAVMPVLVVIGANRAFRRQYDMVTADLVHGDMALMLLDESYGRMIQEWRESRYRPVLGEVHLGSTLAARLIHFAAYYPHYFSMSQGRREFKVTPATPLNCWMDGLLLYFLGCNMGCLYWLIVPLPLRLVYTYPKSIATRRAVLDYLGGKWEGALEKKYVNRIRVAQ
ncbi:MAG: hypothetical protein M3R04_03150 [bacterium]|nr:hypothetical protein [bacterium]